MQKEKEMQKEGKKGDPAFHMMFSRHGGPLCPYGHENLNFFTAVDDFLKDTIFLFFFYIVSYYFNLNHVCIHVLRISD